MPTSQSSTYGDQVASRAVDGNPSFDLSILSCTHTLPERNPYWNVDLGQVKEVRSVKLTGCSDAYIRIEVRVGDNDYYPRKNSV